MKQNHNTRPINLLNSLLILLLAGCAAFQSGQTPAPRTTATGGVPVTTVIPEATTPTEEPGAEALIFRGNDRTINMPEVREPVRLDGDAVMLNFEEAPLTEVVHSILGDLLELDYVIEHPIEGAITLRTRSPVPRDQLLVILESLLQSNGALMVRDPNDRYFVSASPGLSTLLPGLSNPLSEGAGYSNVVVPLSYISASEMAEILRPVATDSAFVRIDNTRNLLVLAGTSAQIDGWMEMISTFDTDVLAGMSVGIFPLENSSVADIDAALGQLLGGGTSGGEGGEGGEASAAVQVPLAPMVRVLPLERLNSLMVVSPRAHYIDQVSTWIERLDQAQNVSGEVSLHVYAVQNGNAPQLASLLSQIFGGQGGGGSTETRQDSGVAPGLTQMGTGSNGGIGGGANMPDTGSGQNNTGASFSLGDNVRVVADSANNALLVYAPQREYDKIRSALEQLDIVPAQVLIEASILEVTLTDGLEFGLEWSMRNGFGDDYVGNGLLNLNESGGIGPRAPGFSYALANNSGAIRAVINTLAERSLVNVISTPSILVLDNRTAAIHVGDQQPVRSAVVVTDGGNSTSSIDYKDTGVKLEVTPTVNAGDLVTMDILQSVTDVGPIDPATLQRSFLERNVSSRVAIRSGESVVLGGLIRDNSSQGRSGLPLLQDIPLVGHLFGRTTNSGARTELLVFITPRVLRSEQDLRDISREMRSRMQGLKHFEDLPLPLDTEQTP